MALWTGILDASRAVDWSGAGVTGGIPTTYTKSGSTVAAYNGTAGTINTALANAADSTYVELGAGTFNLSTGIDISRSNVILRGQGADQTHLIFTGSANYFGLGATIAVTPGAYLEPTSPANSANWTAGYTKGATSITLSSTANLNVNDIIMLTQNNDSAPLSNDVTIGSDTPDFCYGSYGGGGLSGVKEQVEVQRVTSINGSTVGISPGLHCPNWRSGQSPVAWWITSAPVSMVGVEGVSIDHTNSNSAHGIGFAQARDCWLRHCKSVWAPRSHVHLWQTLNCEVRGSHLYEGQSHASQSYGVETMDSTAALVENNIIVKVTAPLMASGATVGCVRAYNYTNDNTYFSATWMQYGIYYHATGSAYTLDEGNYSNGVISDNVHGPSSFITIYRNCLEGWETGKEVQTIPVHIYTLSRYWNVVGNVLGRSVYHNNYECAVGDTANVQTSIYGLGWGGNLYSGGGTNPDDDAFVETSLMQWGNYDVVNNAVRWESSEVPSSITGSYDNAVPSSQTLPSSFFRSSKPAYFGSIPWPAVGPDVSSGNIANKGGYANSIPAKVYYDAASKTNGEIDDFDGAALDPEQSSLPGPANPRWRPA